MIHEKQVELAESPEQQTQPERAESPELSEVQNSPRVIQRSEQQPEQQRNVYVRQGRASWRNNITYL